MITRRQFTFGAAGAGATLALGRAHDANAAPDVSGYRALVCVFLFGGNDAFNMVVPRSAAEHDVYARSRQNLAIARDALMPISPLTSDGALYGFHPRMPEMARLFDAGRVAIVANIGPLIRPVTKAELLSRAAPIPPQLFSHNDQQDQWHTLKGSADLRSGWAGRAADALSAGLSGQQLPINSSLFGTNVFQIGRQTEPYAISADGVTNYALLSPGVGLYAERRAMFERLLALRGASPVTRAYSAVNRRALENVDRVTAALAATPPLTTTLPPTDLGKQLAMVARLIAARDRLAMRRQVFFVAMGGFDTHDDQNQAQPRLLGDVSASLSAFYDAITELGVGDRVTAFTQSDFGRTLTSNGDGTDHGWGSHQLVLGDAVRGREIYGAMPRLEIGGPDDVDAGRIIPTTSVEQYAATLLKWWGLDDAQIDSAAPGLTAFASRNLGFC
jgi:uncharacterized protein (DUF1501 family)